MTRYLVPAVALAAVSVLAFLLIYVIVARSPYTHSNLQEEVPGDYTRTDLGFVGVDDAFLGLGDSPAPSSATAEEKGGRLFITAGCASCHGLRGQGGVVGPRIVGSSESKVTKNARSGPEGMPAYSPEQLSDTDLADIAAFLRSAREEPAGSSTPTATPAATVETTTTPAATPAATPATTPTLHPPSAGPSLDAASATITVDGDDSDWAAVDGLTLTLQQFEIPPGSEFEYDPLDPIEATLKVATDSDNIYVLFVVADDFDFNPDDRNLSASPNVMFRIDQPASPHMGAEEPDFESSLGMVDIWHWELGCGAGEMSGGGDPGSGDDPDCNLDDEYATTPEDREDDDSAQAENSLAAVWDHSSRAQGPGAAGTWIFEFSRPLQTGDPNDAQFASGGIASLALAYFDPDESATGWSDAGHLTSAEEGWITVNLP